MRPISTYIRTGCNKYTKNDRVDSGPNGADDRKRLINLHRPVAQQKMSQHVAHPQAVFATAYVSDATSTDGKLPLNDSCCPKTSTLNVTRVAIQPITCDNCVFKCMNVMIT